MTCETNIQSIDCRNRYNISTRRCLTTKCATTTITATTKNADDFDEENKYNLFGSGKYYQNDVEINIKYNYYFKIIKLLAQNNNYFGEQHQLLSLLSSTTSKTQSLNETRNLISSNLKSDITSNNCNNKKHLLINNNNLTPICNNKPIDIKESILSKNNLENQQESSVRELVSIKNATKLNKHHQYSLSSLIFNALALLIIVNLTHLNNVTKKSPKINLAWCYYFDSPDNMSPIMSHTPSSYHNRDVSLDESSTLGQPNSAFDIATNTDNSLRAGGSIDIELDTYTKAILVPRVSGTKGNINVRNYIVKTLQGFGYHVELDEFTDTTPVGKISFANIIASSNQQACNQLVLACHYDSKNMANFLGATDSAVPCAMLIKLAHKFANSFKDSGLSLRFIFFDGEEAFVEWTDTDSLYGSRHLAAKWAKQAAPSTCPGMQSELDRIKLFILLDLIGARDSSFVSFFSQTRKHYSHLRQLESKHSPLLRGSSIFKNQHLPFAGVQDDHIPFKSRNVPILLLLSTPFPAVWHTEYDNYEAIDWQKTQTTYNVIEEFVENYGKTNSRPKRHFHSRLWNRDKKLLRGK